MKGIFLTSILLDPSILDSLPQQQKKNPKINSVIPDLIWSHGMGETLTHFRTFLMYFYVRGCWLLSLSTVWVDCRTRRSASATHTASLRGGLRSLIKILVRRLSTRSCCPKASLCRFGSEGSSGEEEATLNLSPVASLESWRQKLFRTWSRNFGS